MYFKVGRMTLALVTWSMLCVLWMSELHPFAVGAVVFAVVCLFFQDRVALSNRGIASVTLISLLLCFLCTRSISYLDVGRFLGIGTISLAILGSLLTGLALLLRKEGVVRRALLFTASGTLIACSMSGQLLSVVVVSGVGLVLVVLAYREAQGLDIHWRLGAPLLSTFLLTILLSTFAGWSETRLSYLASLFELSPPAGLSFPAATSLRSLQRWSSDDVVVMRGYGQNPPLYLVGRTFNEFDDKSFWRWNTDNTELTPDQQVLQQTPDGPRAISLFAKSKDQTATPGPTFRMEYPKGGFGFTFYAPRHMYGLSVDLSKLQRYGDGMLQALARDEIDGNYYIIPYSDGWSPHGPPESLSEVERVQHLSLVENLTPEVSRLAQEICGNISDPEKKADFITAYLQQNFTYGYDYPFRSNESALEEFLLKRPPVHCEFFATACALMLRSQGVPTRYINGFVLQEKSLNGNYYVVRLKHAHAWVEAYIPGKGWVTYDPTPPGTLDDSESRAGLGNAFLEFASNMWRKFLAFFSLNPLEMIHKLRNFLASLTFTDYLKLFTLAGLYFFWKRYRRKKPATKHEPRYTYQVGRDEALTPLMESLMDSIHPHEWRRSSAESPREWLQRISGADIAPSLLSRVGEFVDSFYIARYRAQPNEAEQSRLEKLCGELKTSFKGNSLQPRERVGIKKIQGSRTPQSID